jgi:hypothetical protein
VAGGEALPWTAFRGGDRTVATHLRRLGFTVESPAGQDNSSASPASAREPLVLIAPATAIRPAAAVSTRPSRGPSTSPYNGFGICSPPRRPTVSLPVIPRAQPVSGVRWRTTTLPSAGSATATS